MNWAIVIVPHWNWVSNVKESKDQFEWIVCHLDFGFFNLSLFHAGIVNMEPQITLESTPMSK